MFALPGSTLGVSLPVVVIGAAVVWGVLGVELTTKGACGVMIRLDRAVVAAGESEKRIKKNLRKKKYLNS